MATITKRRVERAAKARAEKVEQASVETPVVETPVVAGVNTNQPTAEVIIPDNFHVPANAAEIGQLFVSEDVKGKELDAERTLRFVGLITFALKYPAHVGQWYEHYVTYDPPAGTTLDAETRKAKSEASDWFLDMFGIKSSKGMQGAEKNDQNNLIRRLFKGVRFIVTLWHNEMLSSFGFNEYGGVFIKRKSALGEYVQDKYSARIANPWDVETLNKNGVDKFPMVDRTTQALNGMIAWTDLERMFTGDKASVGDTVTTVGTAAPVVKSETISSQRPAEALMKAVDMRLASLPTGANAFNQCKEMIIRGLSLIEAALSNSVMRQVTDEDRAAFKAFAIAMNKRLGITPMPVANGKASEEAATNAAS